MASLSFYALCPFGLEESLSDEIRSVGGESPRPQRGGVAFRGSTE